MTKIIFKKKQEDTKLLCRNCGKPLTGKQRKFCSDYCKKGYYDLEKANYGMVQFQQKNR